MKALSCIFFVIFPLCCFCTVVEVGNDKEFERIENALDRVRSYDTLLIYTGTYLEHSLVIGKPLTVLAEGEVIIDARGMASDIWLVQSDSVQISGIRHQNVGVSFLKEVAAIKVQRASHVHISNNEVHNCFFGIYLEYASETHIIRNRIYGRFEDEASAGNAIHVWKGKALRIMDNLAEGHRDGIYLEFVDSSYIGENRNYRNLRYGLHFMFSNHDQYTDNLFRDNGAGVAVMFSRDIAMLRNTFIDNWGSASYGLLLKEISDGEIANNRFVKNTTGILAEGASRLLISGNEFLDNGTALNIKGNCLENVLSQNNFIANTFDVVTNSQYNTNEYMENYWSSYSGYDLDRDGFGDVPYRPVDLFSRIINEIPSAMILTQSLVVNLFNAIEKVFPSLIPSDLMDVRPRLTPYTYG